MYEYLLLGTFMMLSKYYFKISPGMIEVSCSDIGVVSVKMGAKELKNQAPKIKWQKELVSLLKKYIKGEPVDFSKIPLDLDKGTPFQKSVWKTAGKIGFGKTKSYGEVAVMVGKPGAARAVGNALGENPAAIIVPCHRVIASDGSLGGFGAGLKWKIALLKLEGAKI
jgi:methylated-DNA-[protein]-cysteine S-methyltransferase